MFLIITEKVLSNFQLTSDEKIVLSMLAVFKVSNKYYWGPANYLAGKCGMDVSAVQQIISKFVDMGVVTTEPQGMMLRIDPAKDNCPGLASPPKTFDDQYLIKKIKKFLDQGYQVVVNNELETQLCHPDKDGIIFFSKVPKKDGGNNGSMSVPKRDLKR